MLRIEDTDRERSKVEYEKAIYEDLRWLGLSHDGEVAKQSERPEIYRRFTEQLLKEGKAAPADDQGKAIKFIMPKKKMVVHDLVHGAVEFDTSLFDDLIIIKSDGMPTYNFACVVDDHEQGITHIIRGDDHFSNTPRQWMLYEALGFTLPKCAHIPLITGSNRSPLSKRFGDVTIGAYREQGYLPAGLLNYFALLGWSPGGNQEFITLSDMAKKFTMKAVGKTSATFDEQKLAWINAQHIKSLAKPDFLAQFRAYVQTYAPLPPQVEMEYAEKVALLFQNRIQTFKQFFEMAAFCFAEQVSYDPQAALKYFTEQSQRALAKLCERLGALNVFEDEAVLEKELRTLADAEGLAAADLIHPARVALTGETVSPGIFELMKTLGRDRVIHRLEAARHYRQEVKG